MQPTDYLPSRRVFLQRGSAAFAAGFALGAASGDAVADDPPKTATLRPAPSTPTGARQAIACSRREAAEAARDVLQQGGNAIDAAVAALLVQFVIEPAMTGLGGYGGSLVIYHAKSGRVRAIDSTSCAPRKFDAASFNAKTAKHGYLAVGVPGNVAGIDSALREFGTQSFRKLASRAIGLAENGIPVTPSLALQFGKLLANIDPISRHAYFPNGVPAQGTTWVQPDLARLMRRLGDEGPGSFYTGEVAATICKQVQANGGTLAETDFHDFRATLADPLHINYRGCEVYTPALPSGGITCLSILKTLEQFDLSQFAPWSPAYYELFVDAANLAWSERERYFGDPEFVQVPVEMLLSEKHAKANAAAIRKGIPAAAISRPAEASHTVNVVVVDKEQNIVSWTATHGDDFGAHVAIEGLGLMLGHGMSRFDVANSSPNCPAPGKRPQHNMSPLVVLNGGQPFAGLGMPGGTRIVNVTTQLAVSLIDFKAAPQRVVSAPRIHTEGHDPIQVSSDMPAAAIEALQRKGHRVQHLDAVGGAANAIVIDAKTGQIEAAANTAAGVMYAKRGNIQ